MQQREEVLPLPRFCFFPHTQSNTATTQKKTGLSIFYSAIFDLASRVLVVGEAFGGRLKFPAFAFFSREIFYKSREIPDSTFFIPRQNPNARCDRRPPLAPDTDGYLTICSFICGVYYDIESKNNNIRYNTHRTYVVISQSD